MQIKGKINDLDIAKKFRKEVLDESSQLRDRLFELCTLFHDRRRAITDKNDQAKLELIGELRKTLAKVCLQVLKPDLVILDEFQRFRDLLKDPEKNATAELAHALFNYSEDLRVLLLSATPYKMYARDVEDEDHYKDFLGTLGFLMFHDSGGIASVLSNLNAFRDGLLTAKSEQELFSLDKVKAAIELQLRSVMCRTERVGNTARLDAMISECRQEPPFLVEDLDDLSLVGGVAKIIDSHDPVEYWKSSPYLLNLHERSMLKRRFKSHTKSISALAEKLPLIASVF